MFYSSPDGPVNCTPQPNLDISGIGVRYLQTLFALALSYDISECSMQDIVLTNVSLQVTTLALILAAYRDATIDIPHSIIGVIMSFCRYTAFDFPRAFLQSPRGARKMNWLWFLDFVCRPIMLVFNCSGWSALWKVQLEAKCVKGASGRLVVFGAFDASVKSAGTLLMLDFGYCVGRSAMGERSHTSSRVEPNRTMKQWLERLHSMHVSGARTTLLRALRL